MKIMLMTDMEGCAGVLDFKNWVEPDGRHYAQGRRLLTCETNAAVEGLFAAGADEVLVVDGHGAGGIDPEALDPRAVLSRGHCDPVWPWGLDRSYAALGFVGQHAKAGTPYSHLTHTGTLQVIDERANGLSIGELALCAKELGVPVILACGEEALAREAEALTPGVVTAAVKRGLVDDNGCRDLSTEQYAVAKLGAAHLSPAKARELIKAAAMRAVAKLKDSPESFKFPELSPPYALVVGYRGIRGGAPFVGKASHPDSFIGLMNTPQTTS